MTQPQGDIAILTDSSCDLPQQYFKKYPIFRLPLIVTCGETAYDQDCGRFVRRGELTAEAFLYAIADETGAFLEFEVRGELNT